MKTVGFQYSDIFANHLSVFFDGGDCAEDLSGHLKDPLLQVLGMNACSPKTVAKIGKELSCFYKVSVNSVTGVVHVLKINLKHNILMVKFLLVSGLWDI